MHSSNAGRVTVNVRVTVNFISRILRNFDIYAVTIRQTTRYYYNRILSQRLKCLIVKRSLFLVFLNQRVTHVEPRAQV